MSDQAFRSATPRVAAPRPAHQPRARLRAVHPAEVRWTVELGSGPLEVRRIGVEDGPPGLAHGTVSRRHFEVRWDALLRCHVGRDLGSHNGSRVDGRDVGRTTAMLRDGTVIQLGDVSLVYEEIPAHAPSVLPAQPLIPGRSPAIASLVEALEQASRHRGPLLLCGEIGTGKEHIARALHQRSGLPGSLVVIDGSASSPAHEDDPHRDPTASIVRRGAGPFAVAAGSTLFLDEIGELPPALQVELTRVLERASTGSEVRVIAATQHDLAERVVEGRLRRDLYAHLARGQLRIPPLRERRGDVLDWFERLHVAWLERRPRHAAQTLSLSAEAAEQLLLHEWPGNLHALDRLVHELATEPNLPRPIPLQRLPAWLLGGSPDIPTQPVSGPPVPRRAHGS